MSSVNNFASTGYYQLFNNSGSQSSGTTAQTNVTQSLLQALSGSSNSTSTSNDAYLLSLSPQAQQYLSATSSNSSSNSGDALFNALQATQSSGTNSTGQSFLLSSKQQASITAIITKYKDAPYTQDTFNSIQNDLNAAGLGTSTLSLLDQNKSFNPAVVLINALNGGSTDSSNTGVASASDEQAKSTAYMQNIISQWKNISGNSGKDTASNSTSANAVTPIGSSSGA